VYKTNSRSKGFFLTEVIIASAIMAMLLVGLAVSMYGFARFNRYQLVRQQCIAAAQAQLDSVSATGKRIPEEDFRRLWPKLDITVERSAGTGQWASLTLLEVTANGMSYSKEVEVRLARYVPAAPPPDKQE
jgi:type II secretory pathway pseudopilin PulG